MELKENVINFFSILRCSAGQLFGLRGPDLARGPLIEDLWSMVWTDDSRYTGVEFNRQAATQGATPRYTSNFKNTAA